MDLFLHDLNQAYTTNELSTNEDTILRYLDYATIEQEISMTAASMFWLDTLYDCNLGQSLPLPFVRYRLSDEHRTDCGISFSFDFGEDLSHDFFSYSSSHGITVEQLTVASYFAFLFKLTNEESDLCIGMNTNGRYKEELKPMIGMFVNVIPLRCQLDPHWSFHQLVEHVKEIITNSLKYSYFPLQRILNQYPNTIKPTFLETSFEFQSYTSKGSKNEMMIGNARIVGAPISINIGEDEIMNKFDFTLTIEHVLNIDQLSCTINASLDLFDRKTIDIITQRFHSMLKQLFDTEDAPTNKPIYELLLILPDEKLLMKSMNNTQVLFPSTSCIHHEFVYQVMKHPQKLAVELDDQSLTYSELLYYVQVLSLNLLNEQRVIVGEIVCQCVERSLSMVIGMMAIEMIGAVYCPLSSRDPEHRLHLLVEQTRSHLVLIHHLTKNKFNDSIISLNIDLILVDNDMLDYGDVNQLLSIVSTQENTAYIIFTSGSTGTPKAVPVKHGNFTACMHSLVCIDTFNKDDTVVQMAKCSFDIHVQEILGTLINGASLIMLQPLEIIDFDYLLKVLYKNQISYMHTVPSDTLFPNLVSLIASICMSKCAVWNLYGPAETTIDCTFYRTGVVDSATSIPIGLPLANYRCLIMDDCLQSVVISQEGELYVGGVGIFLGYLRRDDLTAKALLEVDGEIFYRTGDLVRMDNNGFLHYQGRKDHQIKLHGQRIELGEIEQCLLNTSISACVVIKWGDDQLVSYVQSSNINEEQLHKHCQSHLPPHMIPSIFVILEKLPLNANG
ncbi:unnamed protein product, partial [Rotaria sordida]